MPDPIPKASVSPMEDPLCVLIVEDSPDDATLLVRELRRQGFDLSFSVVQDRDAMDAALDAREWDLVISDHSMPCFDAPAALKLLKAKGLETPFIIVSAGIGDDVAADAMRSGASDFVAKGCLFRLASAVRRAVRRTGAGMDAVGRGSHVEDG
jgi:DNA-binding NtrC family response regulator